MIEDMVFPFTAVIGQDYLKRALILNVINPSIGGVLISGEKGTAKSTLVRGLAHLISDMEFVEVPLNITEDNLVGTIDMEKAIVEGKKSFKSGLLKRAHNNILYVDEINLLSEHIVNCLLEVSSAGINNVEREGISYSHKCKFSIIGTMNPEEGFLRAALLDKFGFYVEVQGSKDASQRIEIIKRRLEFEKDKESYIEGYSRKEKELYESILKAKKILKDVKVTDEIINIVADICTQGNCSGHRAEIVIIEAAKAIAALENRCNITLQDIKEAASYALPHRIREASPDISNYSDEKNSTDKDEDTGENTEESHLEEMEEEKPSENEESIEDEKNHESEISNNSNSSTDKIEDINNFISFKLEDISPLNRKFNKIKGTGKRIKSRTDMQKGRYVKYSFPRGKIRDLAFDATLRAAAPYQKFRENNGFAFSIKKEDFREKVREHRTGSTILFVVDASGSMGVEKRMKEVKGTILSLLTDAYEKRDKVGMIAFRKESAEVLLDITRSVDLAERCLKEMPTGGKTPLSAGLKKAYEVIKFASKKEPNMFPIIVLISDGRTNVAQNSNNPLEEAIGVARQIREKGIHTIVIDTEEDFVKLKLAKEIAENMNAEYYKLEDISSKEISKIVKNYLN